MRIKLIFEFIILIVCASFTINFIPEILTFGILYGKYYLLFSLLGIYFILFGRRLKVTTSRIGSYLIFTLLGLYIYEVLRTIINPNYNLLYPIIVLGLQASIIIFYLSLKYSYTNYTSVIKCVFNFLTVISVIILLTGILAFVLMLFNVRIGDTQIPRILGYDFLDRIYGNAPYARPDYFRMILFIHVYTPFLSASESLLGMNKFGMFEGFSYEPHLNMLFISPFIIHYIANDRHRIFLRVIVLLAFLFYALLSISATNLTVLIIVFCVYLANEILSKKTIPYLFAFIFLCIFVLVTNPFLAESIWKFLMFKYQSGSYSISFNFLAYFFSFDLGIGDGILKVPREDKLYSAGLLSSFSFILAYLLFFRLAYLVIKIKNIKYYGYAFLYVLLHSLKIPVHMWSYTVIIFWVLSILFIYEFEKENVLQQTG